jgi:hypothetical protein
MSNLSDKEIDRLSRDAADSYEPDASSLSWTRLEQKLVEQMPERPPDGFRFGRISPYVWGPAVVLIAGISFYFIKTNNYSKLSTRNDIPVTQEIRQTDSNKLATAGSYADSLSAIQNKDASQNDPTGDLGNSAHAANSPSSQVNARPDASSPNGQMSATANGANKTSSDYRGEKKIISAGATASTGVAMSNGNAASGTDISTTNEGAPASTASASVSSGMGNTTHDATRRNMPAVITAGATLGVVKGNDSLLNSLAAQNSPEPHKSVHINRSLSIGFAFGADYTDGGGVSNDQLSNSIGITLGYYLTSKLSVNTGLIYSNKFYWAPGNNQNRSGMPANGVNTFAWAPDIEYINGAFNLYEVPLTLRYDFAKNDKTRFFVNAGASSYFLVKQTNIYYAHNGGRRLSAWMSQEESPTNYWFGVGDLSFGLETDLGKGFSFQAEPYFKIPFQKMGVNNLKIYSYGFQLSFRYAPVLSRTKK